MHELIVKIANRLVGMDKDDMTTAERQIANLLVQHNYCKWDVHSCLDTEEETKSI